MPYRPEINVGRQGAAVTHAGESPQFRSAACLHVEPFGYPWRSCGDIDHPVDRVRAPKRPAGSADDLDAIDILEQIILHVPKHAGK